MRNNSIRDLNSILIYKNATDVYSFKQSIHVMCIDVLHTIFREITFAQQELKQLGTHHDAVSRWVGWTVAGRTTESGGFGQGRVRNVCHGQGRPFGFAFFGHVFLD